MGREWETNTKTYTGYLHVTCVFIMMEMGLDMVCNEWNEMPTGIGWRADEKHHFLLEYTRDVSLCVCLHSMVNGAGFGSHMRCQ